MAQAIRFIRLSWSYMSHPGKRDSFDEGQFRPDRPSSTLVSLERPLARRPRESTSTTQKRPIGQHNGQKSKANKTPDQMAAYSMAFEHFLHILS